MKYILSLTLLLFAVLGTTFAQDGKNAAELKNKGNAALKSKDYKTALSSYEGAIAAWKTAKADIDPATVYNTATCAYKLKINDKALTYYKQAQQLDYKGDLCHYYQYKIYKSEGKLDEAANALKEGIKNYPNGKYANAMKKELNKPVVKEANNHFKKAQAKLNTRTSKNVDKWDAIKKEAIAECDKAIALCDKALATYPNDKNAKAIKNGCTTLKNAK